MAEKIYKHDVWEWSRDMSMYLAGANSRELLAAKANESMLTLIGGATPEQTEEITEWATNLRQRIEEIQGQAESTARLIMETEELPKEVALWRTADLTKYLAAAQKYDIHELLVTGVLSLPNLEILFEMVEPGYDE